MATNTNKRAPTKHIRDGIKAKYKKCSYCEICGVQEHLELHHYTTVSLLLKSYAEANSISIANDDDVLAMREKFYQTHSFELIEDTVTLCKAHHASLHKTYGVTPPLHTAKKQAEWVKKRRDTVGVLDVLPEINSTKGAKKKNPEIKLNTCDLSSFQTTIQPLSDYKV